MTFTQRQLAEAFDATAQATGSDFLQICEEMGEEPRIDRDALCDYLPMYGGPHGEAILKALCDGSLTDADLDKAKIPRHWN